MTTLKVQRRNMETKAKKLRREGYVTGNLFGKEIEGSIPLQIEKQEAERIERECMKGSQFYLELDGKTYDVLIKEMDYRPMDHQILEMDFQALVKGEKVHSVAEVILLNKEKVTEGVLAATSIWGEDLNNIPGLTAAVKADLDSIQEKGMLETVKGIL